MHEDRAESPPPLVLAMVLADEVRRDPATGKYSILGVFNAVSARAFPCPWSALALYLSVTGGRGLLPMTVRLVDVDETRSPVFEHHTAMHFPSPTEVVETAIVLHGPVFPAPGDYRCQLYAAGDLLRELRLRVLAAAPPGARPAPGPNR